ncbi:MAG: methylenetetrahydrofolate reductase [NAD(P)H] [Acidobacteria bacterium]|nr:methylenetetrahydrofolate reductase [NAD(P)H] [Acidobacteriota bacterium]
MGFSELYLRGRQAISFEVFPPRTDVAMENLQRVLPELVDLRPDLMTVTYGALGSTRDRTLEIAAIIRNRYNLETACHLTCVGSSRTDLDRILNDICAAGIRNVVALRGDPPQGETSFVPPPDGYRHANELVRHIRIFESRNGSGRLGIAVAGYPEKHIEAPDMETDLKNLKNKVETGGDAVITQLFYDNRFYFRFVEAARAIGITAPIVPGLLPIVSVKQILRITSLCGSSIPDPLREQLESAGEEDALAEEIGVRHCISQARDLLERGVPGIHFYVLNRASHMKRIMEQIPR